MLIGGLYSLVAAQISANLVVSCFQLNANATHAVDCHCITCCGICHMQLVLTGVCTDMRTAWCAFFMCTYLATAADE